MNKASQINFRINSNLLKVLKGYCSENDIPISSFFTVLAENILTDKKVPEKLKKKVNLLMIKHKRTKLCSQLYIVKNMYRRVLDMAYSYFYTTGSVNMKAINAVIDSFVDEFENYEALLQDKIGTDFRITVKRLRNQEWLLEQSKNYKMLNYVSSKK